MLVFIGRPEFPVLGWVHMSNKLWLWVSIYMHAAYRVEEPRTFLTASHGMRRLGDKAGGTDKRERERGTNNFPRTVRPRFFCHPRERTRLLRRTSKQIWDRSQPRNHRTPCLLSTPNRTPMFLMQKFVPRFYSQIRVEFWIIVLLEELRVPAFGFASLWQSLGDCRREITFSHVCRLILRNFAYICKAWFEFFRKLVRCWYSRVARRFVVVLDFAVCSNSLPFRWNTWVLQRWKLEEFLKLSTRVIFVELNARKLYIDATSF